MKKKNCTLFLVSFIPTTFIVQNCTTSYYFKVKKTLSNMVHMGNRTKANVTQLNFPPFNFRTTLIYTGNSRYREYLISRTFFPSLWHYPLVWVKILSISRTFWYLEQYFWSSAQFSLVISNFSPNF